MADTPSTMLKLGTSMPAFELADYNGVSHRSAEYEGKPIVVLFMCNHCPFVRHIIDTLAEKAKDLESMGVAVVGINSNDVEAQPGDSPEEMKKFAAEHGIAFPYLVDESQAVAAAFRAACTPDFFLFDGSHRLVYRGQFDGSRPSNDIPVTGRDLLAAATELLAGRVVSEQQKPSLGCNIKWKPGNEPSYWRTVFPAG